MSRGAHCASSLRQRRARWARAGRRDAASRRTGSSGSQSVGELAIALKEFAPRHARVSVERVLRTMQTSGATTPRLPPSGTTRAAAYADTVSADDVHVGTASSWGQTESTRKKRRDRKALVTAGVAVGLVLVLGGGAVILRSGTRADLLPAASGTVTSATSTASPAIATPPADSAIARSHPARLRRRRTSRPSRARAPRPRRRRRRPDPAAGAPALPRSRRRQPLPRPCRPLRQPPRRATS